MPSPSFGFSVPQAAAFRDGHLASTTSSRSCSTPKPSATATSWWPTTSSSRRTGRGSSATSSSTRSRSWRTSAAETERLRLVLGCLVVPYRQPLSVAKAMATLDQLSGAVRRSAWCRGTCAAEFDALGVPFAERLPMTDEFIEIMRTVWTDDHATFHGDVPLVRRLEPEAEVRPAAARADLGRRCVEGRARARHRSRRRVASARVRRDLRRVHGSAPSRVRRRDDADRRHDARSAARPRSDAAPGSPSSTGVTSPRSKWW